MHPKVKQSEPGSCPECGMFLTEMKNEGTPPAELPACCPREKKTTYTCPMHPEVKHSEPGSCPECGMFLKETKTPASHGKDSPDEKKNVEQISASVNGHEHIAAAHQPGRQAAPALSLYSCGMHPTVIREGPGNCPICGMDLTPMKGGTASSQSGPRKISHWVAPMDPNHISDKPGKSPMGMDLVPVYEEAGSGHPGIIEIDPVVVRNMGVRVAPVERGAITRMVRTFGEVEVAENLVSVVNLNFSGWIEELYADETGRFIKQGEPLFSIYSPELVTAQEEYILAVGGNSYGISGGTEDGISGGTDGGNSDGISRGTGAGDTRLAEAVIERVRLWDLPVSILEKAARTGKAARAVTIKAPRSGYILHKNAVEGGAVRAGADLFRIGGLNRVWVHAEVYEIDSPWVKTGRSATLELPFQPGKTYTGEVAYIHPTLNPKSRTLKARLEFDNPDLELKPGMSATINIETRPRENTLVLPSEAIIYTGERKIVFVAGAGDGKYEPREIVTGAAGDGAAIEVLSGLEAGEMVVVSGQFLLDSESQLREAVRKMLEIRMSMAASRAPRENPEG